jgi:hypothetical protein
MYDSVVAAMCMYLYLIQECSGVNITGPCFEPGIPLRRTLDLYLFVTGSPEVWRHAVA